VLFYKDVFIFFSRNTIITELSTANLDMCTHYQVAVLEHSPCLHVWVLFFRLLHNFGLLGLLEVEESLWQAKVVETTTAETVFSATLSTKPPLNYCYILPDEHKKIYILVQSHLSQSSNKNQT